MLPEQQQRIMGYFIEEAKDHLNTIEQGLLNLQVTIEDPELVNEVFRAAHSVKGGAAMLGFTSIQQTAHRLEDSFKVLKECSVKVDQQLESLFLRIFDTLQGLLEQLSGPFGLTEELGEQMVRELEPVFEELNSHLGGLLGNYRLNVGESSYQPIPQQSLQQHLAGMGAGLLTTSNSFTASSSPYTDSMVRLRSPTIEAEAESALHLVFDTDVPACLREMLQAFKQPEGYQSRRLLKSICRNLKTAGEEFELPHWTELIEAVEVAIANPENTYRTLAPAIIRDIKQAQELVLSGQAAEITVGAKLRSLLPVEQEPETDFEDLFAFAQPMMQSSQSAAEDIDLYFRNPSNPRTGEQPLPSTSGLSIDEMFYKLDSGNSNDYSSSRAPLFDDSPGLGESDREISAFSISTHIGPEVGASELNTLADLFEGESPDLDEAWEKEKDLDNKTRDQGTIESDDDDSSGDFTDLMFEEYVGENSEAMVGERSRTIARPPIDEFTRTQSPDILKSDRPPHTADAKEPDLREPRTQKQPEINNTANSIAPVKNSTPSHHPREQDALGTLLDQVAAQTTTSDQNSADLDKFLIQRIAQDVQDRDLDQSEFTEGSIDSSDYLPDLDFDSFDTESDEPGEGNRNNQNYGWDTEEMLNLLEMEDFAPLTRPELSHPKGHGNAVSLGEGSGCVGSDDSDLNDLLGIVSGFLTRENPPQENRNHRNPTAPNPQNTETDSSLKGHGSTLSLDSDLDNSLDQNWLQKAFSLEDESNLPENLELDDTELSVLFRDRSSDPISRQEKKQPRPNIPTGPTSREVADLTELLGSIPTGTEYEREESDPATELRTRKSEESNSDWLNFESDVESLNIDLELEDSDLASLFSDPEFENSDRHPENLETVELELLSDRSDTQTSTTTRDENRAFDLLEEMFGETAPLPSPDPSQYSGWEGAENADIQDRDDQGEELSASLPPNVGSLFDESDADLFDGIETDAMNRDSDDDLFDALETDLATGDLNHLSAELGEDIFDRDLDIQEAEETGATLNTAAWLGFDELLDSIDAPALVTSELSTVFLDTDAQQQESDSAQLEAMDLSDFFNTPRPDPPQGSGCAGTENDSGNFDDLEALLIAGEAEAALAASEEANPHPVSTEIFSDLEEFLSDRETEPELKGHGGLKEHDGLKEHSSAVSELKGHGSASLPYDEFDDLDTLLRASEDNSSLSSESNIGTFGVSSVETPSNIRGSRPKKPSFSDQVRVPVKQLDNLSNLMGELIVNRNSLEQDQERMRQFLDNLLHQVTLLSDVSQRTQDFYERSLLEIALLANRQGRSPWRSEESSHQRESAWRPEEMDRFTPFHSLAQEIIELIVRVRESAADIEFLVDEADQVTRQLRQVTTQLQEGLTKARMKPFAETTDRLFRAVREIGIKCGKQAQLQVEGKDILIDKMIVDQLYDPMTHLVNNAITHGIEPPDVRLTALKPAIGKITIRAFHQGNQTVISVSDDGAGIDPQKVKDKAIKKGWLTTAQAQRMSRSEVYDLLFMPGFSTQDQATEYAGRGVGLDVVRTSLQEIRGSVGIDSTIGRGTVFTIRLPLVLSISKALCCISDRARIAFPMDGVEDMIDVPREQVTTGADGQPCIEWRGSTLPFRPLRDLLAYHRHLGRGSVYGFNTDDDIISVIVLRSAGNFLAVQVDQVSTEQEIVIKQLEGPVPKPLGIAGATVLGDGRIVAIADVLELIDLATGKLRKDTPGTLWDEGVRVPAEPIEEKAEPTVLIVDDSITVRSLLSITFEKAGYRVEEARDGKEAWEKMKSGLPCDIVFCDIEMPRMDGLELLSRMQKDPVLCDLPIAMLTSRGADRHRQMAYGLGAKGYFTKPYLEEQLMDAASRMLKGEVVGAPAVV